MAFFPNNNLYTNDQARRAWYTAFGIFALWWIFRFLGGVFHRTYRAPAAGAAAGAGAYGNAGYGNAGALAPAAGAAAAPTGLEGGRIHRIGSALRDLFISTFAVVVFNYFTNGILENFNILLWVTLALGVLWAFARSVMGRLSDFLILPLVIAGFVLLWVYAFVHHSYM